MNPLPGTGTQAGANLPSHLIRVDHHV